MSSKVAPETGLSESRKKDRKAKKSAAASGVKTEASSDKIFAESFITSWQPYRRLMRAIFLFPFTIDDTWKGGHLVEHNPYSPFSIGFTIICIGSALVALIYNMNLVGLLLNVPPSKNVTLASTSIRKREVYPSNAVRAHELYVLQRNIMAALVAGCILFQATYSAISIYFHMKFLCEYYSFWMRTVEEIRIDAASGATKSLLTRLSALFVFILLLVIMAVIKSKSGSSAGDGYGLAPIITGTQSVICMILFRIFNWIDIEKDGGGWAIHFSDNFKYYRASLACLLLYTIVVSKSYVILYAWTCDLLKQSFAVWNNRLERVLHRGESEDTREHKVANRTGYDHLFKDHVCLLDLTEGADQLFSGIIRWFYATEMICLCFEFFHAWRSQQAQDEFQGGRRFDGGVMMVFVVYSLYFLVTVSWSAAYVSEEAMNGLEIIRRKGLLGRKENDEMYFMLSLYTSFTGHFSTGLSMGGYADVNKGFLVALFGTALTYGILLFQFTPPLVYKDEEYLRFLRLQNMTIDELNLIERTEFTADPFDYGQTFIKLESFAPDWDPNGPDLWDFFHAPDFLAYYNLTNGTLPEV